MTKKIPKKHCLFLVIMSLLWGLSGCQVDNLRPATTTPGVSPFTVTAIPTKSSATATLAATVTPLPTAPSIATPTTLPIASLAEKGTLLLWNDKGKHYLVIDLNTGITPYTVRWNPECEWDLLPGSTTVVCERASGQLYLLDVIDGEKHDLAISDVGWFNHSSNGRFIVYSQGPGELESIFAYDLSTNVTRTLALNVSQQEREQWLDRPALSSDGQHLAVARSITDQNSVSIFEILQNAQVRQVGLSEPPATLDMVWSPADLQFVYGATDVDQEIAPLPNYLFISDLKTGDIRQIARSPDSLFFWSSSLEWSPTGKQIAVGLWDLLFTSTPQGCVIDVNTAEQVCLPAVRSANGRFMIWSPSGEHIAFVDTAGTLSIGSSDGTEVIKVLKDVPEDFLLFWR